MAQQKPKRVQRKGTLAEEVRKFRAAAEEQPASSMARELLLRRARQAETASHVNDSVSSPGLAQPK